VYLFDGLHLLTSAYEMVISRTRSQTTNPDATRGARLVGLGSPIANCKDVCEWMGVDNEKCCFNFGPSARAQCPSIGQLQLNISSFDLANRHHRLL